MKRHANVPVFVPHAGCPHACSFCDQRAISGRRDPPAPEDVRDILQGARHTLREKSIPAEIAFFGGSFTAIDPACRRSLLAAAGGFLGDGTFTGVRVSTRPDAIDDGLLRELKAGGVTAIELGAQSMDGEVLRLSGRGHTAGHTVSASRLIRAHGFSLGLQMMTGLPGDTDEKALATARALAELQPDTMRIYPTLILQGTALEKQYREGAYRPQTLEEAVTLCARLLRFFHQKGVRVIRVGIHQEAGMQSRLVAGPHHPAFRELAEGQLLLEEAVAAIRGGALPPGPIRISVAPGAQGKMAGQKRRNLEALSRLGYSPRIYADDRLGYLQVGVAAEGGGQKNACPMHSDL